MAVSFGGNHSEENRFAKEYSFVYNTVDIKTASAEETDDLYRMPPLRNGWV